MHICDACGHSSAIFGKEGAIKWHKSMIFLC
ncbi:MAG: hypothetical protein LRY43_04170 [Gammaproteobacteria bacterium]|nr:hypothetical protein [Gammaproteobacteria bacterium]